MTPVATTLHLTQEDKARPRNARSVIQYDRPSEEACGYAEIAGDPGRRRGIALIDKEQQARNPCHGGESEWNSATNFPNR